MKRFLGIFNNEVVSIKDYNGETTNEVFEELFKDINYDTIVEDFTNTYILNETYEIQDYQVRNNINQPDPNIETEMEIL